MDEIYLIPSLFTMVKFYHKTRDISYTNVLRHFKIHYRVEPKVPYTYI